MFRRSLWLLPEWKLNFAVPKVIDELPDHLRSGPLLDKGYVSAVNITIICGLNMSTRDILIRFLVAGLTFSIGVSLYQGFDGPPSFATAVFLCFVMPMVSMEIVIHQGARLGKEWRPAFGKAFLATSFWLFPSCFFIALQFVCLVGLFPAPDEAVEFTTRIGVVLFAFNFVYGLIGAGLCWWVNRYDAGDHWLLRRQQFDWLVH